MPAVDQLFAQSVILLRRQFALFEELYLNQKAVLREYELAYNSNSLEVSHVLRVYNHVFSLIDHIERYRKISQSVPKLNKRSLHYRKLSASISKFSDARNIVQHLNNSILNEFSGSLLGSIFWLSNNQVYTICLHDLGRERYENLAVNIVPHASIHKFCYVHNGKFYELSQAIEAIKEFDLYIRSEIEIQVENKEFDVRDHFISLVVEVIN